MSTPQSGPSSSKSKTRLKPTPPTTATSTPSTWRCTDQKRLHRDNEACTNAPPSSPIIDTPSKRMRLERKLAGSGGQSQSQQTQPTPRPQRSGQSRPQIGFVLDAGSEGGSSSQSGESTGSFQLLGSPKSVHSSNYVHPYAPPSNSNNTPVLGDLSLPDPAVPASWTDEDLNVPHLASEHSNTSNRIPETPGNPSTAPPRLPRLTESNLLALNSNSISSPNPLLANAHSSNAAISSPSAPPSPSSTTSSAHARINRLLLRTHLTTLNHRAELSLAHQNLLAAQDLACREISRRKFWEAVCLVLVLLWVFYGAWVWWNEAEFEYARARGRERFGLD